jgi:hypothetical protein
MLHAQGQVTTKRLTTLLNGIGLDLKASDSTSPDQADGWLCRLGRAVSRAGLVSLSYVG